ncbi:MAG: arylsulfatase A-like enzyme [Candidatus Azotimanducaceae bacterium]|jgi:arylsulfatase A-like enzyme
MLGFASRLSAVVLLCLTTTVSHASQPNMIFVLVDDLRFDGMGFVNPVLETPHLDRMAAEGMYLPNAVVTTSLCSPSRATILTGQTTRNHGIVDNNDNSEKGLVYFPSHLQAAGYQTAFVGKWHMGRGNDNPRPGFDHWVSFKGQGAYHPTQGIPQKMIDQGVRHQLNVNGSLVPQAGYITDELTDYALQWLDSRQDKTKDATGSKTPFFLYLSHKAVHADFSPAERHAGMYDDVEIPMANLSTEMPKKGAGKPMWVTNQRNSWHGVDFPYHSDLSLQEYLKRYYATLTAVDDSMGRIFAWLKESGELENTVVVFFSDNGFLFGEHGLIDKRNAYEPSVRVPMLVHGAGRIPVGQVVESRVRNLDLAPTFLDWAGASAPPEFEGQSLVPLLEGKVAEEDWQVQPFVYEYYWEWTFPQTPTTFAITEDEIKYIQYHGLWDLEELYDLRTDPEENVNLIHDPAYVNELVTRRKALYQALANRQGRHAVPFSEKRAQGLRFRRRSGSETANFPESYLRDTDADDLTNGFRPPSE